MDQGLRASTDVQRAEAFREYYSTLYDHNTTLMAHDLTAFMRDLPVDGLSKRDRAALEEDITVDELGAAMSHVQSGKAPGPNGYPIEFYRASWA